MIFVPAGTEGMETTPIDTMGGRETNTVYFNDCEVPAEQLLGEQDRGWMQLIAGLNIERVILVATMLGIGSAPSTTPLPTPRSASSSAAPSDGPLYPFTARCTRSNGTAGRPVPDLAHWSMKPFGCSQSASWVTPSRERSG
jgi:hypothetical protein